MTLFLTAIASVAFVAWAWSVAKHQSSPAYVYEHIWKTLKEHMYDPSALEPWETWRERHLHKLTNRADVVRYANEMLEPLHDPYTIAISSEQLSPDVNWETCNCVGVGISIATAYQDVTPDVCAAESARTGASCSYPTIVGVTHNSPAAKAGMRARDIITNIDSWDTAGQPLGDVLKRMRGTKKDWGFVTLTVERAGKRDTFRLKRDLISEPTAWSHMIGDDIGYLRIANFSFWSEEYAVKASEALTKCKAVIVDVRDNPGGEVLKGIRLCGLFTREGHVTTLYSREPGTDKFETAHIHLSKGGLLQEVGDYVQDMDTPNLPTAVFAGKPIVVLVNENTASSAELFTGGMSEAVGATIIGTKTFGKGVSQLTFNLPDGGMLKITTGRFYFPSGYWLGDGSRNKYGIQPHITVPPQLQHFDLGSDADQTVSVAVDLLRKQVAP